MAACKNRGMTKDKTTPDGLFTLTEVECIGNCANAPVVQINDDNYEDLDYDSMTRILDALAAGEQPGPERRTRGAAPAIPKAARRRWSTWCRRTTTIGRSGDDRAEIGRASCRERGGKYV